MEEINKKNVGLLVEHLKLGLISSEEDQKIWLVVASFPKLEIWSEDNRFTWIMAILPSTDTWSLMRFVAFPSPIWSSIKIPFPFRPVPWI